MDQTKIMKLMDHLQQIQLSNFILQIR